jgi:lysophospholipase L1-like esterase
MTGASLSHFFAGLLAAGFVLFGPRCVEAADAEAPRVVLVGDSTVASDGGWGDGLARLFRPGVECVNMGRPGRSSKSYRAEGHWEKVLELKPQWVVIQFGHNDQPGKGPERETDPATTYRENMARYVEEAQSNGARLVLVTSLTRRIFRGEKIESTLGPYVDAVKQVAAEKKVPVVDLHTRSIEQMERIGRDAAVEFNHKPKDPNKPDRTHLSPKGERETAKLVAAELRKVAPELAAHLRPETEPEK